MSVRGPARARARVISGGDPGVVEERPRPVVLASWLRSRNKGIDPSAPVTPPAKRRTGDSRLLRAAAPAVEAIHSDLVGSSTAFLVVDASGFVLHRSPTSRQFAEVLDNAGMAPGQDLGEQAVGTNAAGLALAEGEVVVVRGSEHYHDRFQALDGTATPVRDPVNGRTLGALAMYTRTGLVRPAHVALVRQTGLLVEQRLLGLDAERHQRLLARYLTAARAPGDPIFAVSEQTFHAGPETTRRLDGLTHEDLWPLARDALTTRPTATVQVTLPDGGGVGVRLEAVQVGGALVGAIGEVLDGAPFQPVPSVGPSMTVPEFATWSPAARRTAAALRRAAEERRTVCVVGEDGSGKATTVRLVAGRTFLGRNLVQLEPAEATVERVRAELADDAPVLVVDAQELPAEQLLALVDAARDAPGDGWLALTYAGRPEALDEHVLEARLNILPATPLRARPQDVEAVLPAMVRRHAGGRDLELSPALVDRLRREPWPTNFHGLEAVVAEMVRSATKRTLDLDDLPPGFGTTLRRRLTPMEWMTRSAIVSALQASGGSKELAAESLGMSRASIYRKIKAFDIDVRETATD